LRETIPPEEVLRAGKPVSWMGAVIIWITLAMLGIGLNHIFFKYLWLLCEVDGMFPLGIAASRDYNKRNINSFVGTIIE
jgi:hypothetical protein